MKVATVNLIADSSTVFYLYCYSCCVSKVRVLSERERVRWRPCKLTGWAVNVAKWLYSGTFSATMSSGVARRQRLGEVQGIWQVPRQGPRAEPRWGLRTKPPEAEKHDIDFVLRITLVDAYRPFYSAYNVYNWIFKK